MCASLQTKQLNFEFLNEIYDYLHHFISIEKGVVLIVASTATIQNKKDDFTAIIQNRTDEWNMSGFVDW